MFILMGLVIIILSVSELKTLVKKKYNSSLHACQNKIYKRMAFVIFSGDIMKHIENNKLKFGEIQKHEKNQFVYCDEP